MNSNQNVLMAMFMMLSITVVAVTIPVSFVSAQGKAHPPIGLFGNPNDFRTGPPIPSCNEILIRVHQVTL